MAETKIQSAIEDFDWEAYENGETAGSKSREELTNTYDESLKTPILRHRAHAWIPAYLSDVHKPL